MRRAALTIVSTVTALVLLLGFKTHKTTAVASPAAIIGSSTTGTSSSGTSSGTTPTTSSPSTSTTTTTTTTTAGSSTGSRTVTGTAVDTRYGPVQVRLTITNGTITAAQAVEYPEENPRDAQINAYAVPVLNEETVAAKSADIQTVSGATYTSDGYIQSLQSALDKVG